MAAWRHDETAGGRQILSAGHLDSKPHFRESQQNKTQRSVEPPSDGAQLSHRNSLASLKLGHQDCDDLFDGEITGIDFDGSIRPTQGIVLSPRIDRITAG